MPRQEMIAALLGVCVGDAAGAVLEFFSRKIQQRDVEEAMTMPGGGVFNVGKGQPTDDTELTLCLLHALMKHKPTDPFPVKTIVTNYIRWMNQSRPFDYGTTTHMAFGNVTEDQDIVSNVRRNAEKYSFASEANGALMRVIPIAIWYHDLGYDIIAEYAREDAKLSHPNIICQECNAVYAITVAFLINNPKDSHSAMTIAEEYVRERCSITVQTWFYDALRENLLFVIDCKQNIGHVKHAFQLAFHFLFYEVPFAEALHDTLYRGGDTDTNAAIVCGMMGAYHGSIPIELSEPVMTFDCTKTGRIRPPEYSVRVAIQKLQKNDISSSINT
jgi:ADP-ribosyl-[dinitrogen reductase] hydrolase